MNTAIILHDIRSIHNVGSIWRTADCSGVGKIYLTGYTPSPHDRFGRTRKDLAKTALGAEKNVPFEKTTDIFSVLEKLKKEKFRLIAVEQSPDSIDYKKVKRGKKIAFILGNEVEGLSPEILKECDTVAEIPMYGKKESLNVGVAAGIALFKIMGI